MSDRSAMIRLANSLPQGSQERRDLLAQLKQAQITSTFEIRDAPMPRGELLAQTARDYKAATKFMGRQASWAQDVALERCKKFFSSGTGIKVESARMNFFPLKSGIQDGGERFSLVMLIVADIVATNSQAGARLTTQMQIWKRKDFFYDDLGNLQLRL